jgi:leader peptidase (prepilin peptidase)/N-methyltransferase
MSTGPAAVLAGVLGLAIGSFLNVVIHRLPLGQSLSRPRSRCPGCEGELRSRDNLPVVSWLALRGRCRGCGGPISARYPLVELLTAVLCVAVVLTEGADRDVWLGLAFVLLLVPITFIDLDHRIIPNKLTALGAVVAIALVAILEPGQLAEHLIAGVAAGGFLLLAAIAYPAGMGMGDVKLAGVMGLFLGRAIAPAMFAALVAGSLVGIVVMRRHGRKAGVPFGPFLALGGLVGLFAGDALVDWYLDTLA